jgi:hypothetical protein
LFQTGTTHCIEPFIKGIAKGYVLGIHTMRLGQQPTGMEAGSKSEKGEPWDSLSPLDTRFNFELRVLP